jgi:hypothetical protein
MMDQNEKKRRRAALRAKAVLALFAAGATVGAVLLFRLCFGGEIRLLARILFGIGGGLVALFALLGWFILAAVASAGRVHGNLFLYDPKTKTNLDIGILDADLMRARLDECLGLYLRARDPRMIPGRIRELLMPYLLLCIIDGGESDWVRLLGNEKELIDEMCAALSVLGAEELGRLLQYHRATFDGRVDAAVAAISPKKAELEQAMLAHIRRHIDEYEL